MLLDSIRTQLDSLSKSEKKVALAVLEQPTQTVSQNITALAKNAQVSEPTVVRFCRTLGYDGWHEFKLKLAQGLALPPAGGCRGVAGRAACARPPAPGSRPARLRLPRDGRLHRLLLAFSLT